MLRRYPFVEQEGEKDCGVASLAMIILYYKGQVPLEVLRELSKTDRRGVTAYHLVTCAKEIGFHARGIKCTLEDLESNVHYPLIAHITLEEKYQHYIVIYRIEPSKKRLLVADPNEKKLKRMSYREFLTIWDQVVIELYPYKPLPRYSNSTSFIELFRSLVSHFKWELLQVFFLSIFVTIFAIVLSFYFQSMIDGMNHYSDKNYYYGLFILFLVIAFLKEMTNYFRNDLMIRIAHRIDYLLTNGTFERILHLPYHYYRNRTTGEIVSRMNDLGVVQNFISRLFVTIFVDCLLSLVCLICLCLINVKLTGIAIGIALCYVFLWWLFRPWFSKYIQRGQALRGEVHSHMVESIAGYETIQSLSLEKNREEGLETKYYKWTNNQIKWETLYNIQLFFKELLGQIGFLWLILIGVYAVLDQTLSLGMLLTYQMLFSYFIEPIKSFIDADVNFKEVKFALKRVLELFVEVNDKTKTLPVPFSFPIEFRHLNYTYNDQKWILKNIDLKIEQGEKMMIVGNSGGGKSTLLKLILQDYPIERNQLSIGNCDINDYDRKELKQNIAYISQQEMLFTGTLYDNLTLDRQVPEDEFLKVARLCEIDQIIKNEPLGYFMLIEENGFNLSGGERERIFLARSLLRNHFFLMIDEGMGQMDLSMERRILKSIMKEYPALTLIVVSHRTDNQDLFDRMIEIKEGKIRKDVRKNVME